MTNKLTDIQTKAAKALRTIRPITIPGTDVIPDMAQREAFYLIVGAAMEYYGAATHAPTVNAFCALAGIPD